MPEERALPVGCCFLNDAAAVTNKDHYEVVVVGAGQSGLAMGYYLQRLGLDFLILDAALQVGDAWRHRWDSLRLFTSARFSALPGSRFPGDPDRYPTKDEVADYLRYYANRLELPIWLNQPVEHLTKVGETYTIKTTQRSYNADTVVIAVGGRHAVIKPSFADRLSDGVVQLDTAEYRRPEQFPRGTVVVIGSGDSGRQISEELLASGRDVVLARGTWRLRLPQRAFGRDIIYWLDKANAMRTPTGAHRTRWVRRHEPVIGPSLRGLRREGVRLASRAVDAEGATLRFEDGEEASADGVLWSTGFKCEFSWIHLPVLDDRGVPRHNGGVTECPGIYFLGLPWQRVAGSALIGWVGDDAGALAERISQRRSASDSRRLPSSKVSSRILRGEGDSRNG